MKYYNILIVDDDDVDVMNVQRAMSKNQIINPLHRVSDGIEALEFLRDPQNTNLRPIIILLDLNMPRMGGIEFLQNIRNDKKLKRIPVIVMTVSDDDKDKLAAYDEHIQGYVIKPMKFENFRICMEQLNAYWAMCELP